MNQESQNILESQVTLRSRKAGRSHEVTFGDLPYQSQLALVRYGAQRFINDKLGGADIGPEEAAKAFDAILAQLLEGTISTGRQGSASLAADPVEKKARSLARDRIKAMLRAKGIALKAVGKDKMAELTEQMLEKDRSGLMAEAERILEIQNQSLDLNRLDLSDINF